jgi:hypothetical protein
VVVGLVDSLIVSIELGRFARFKIKRANPLVLCQTRSVPQAVKQFFAGLACCVEGLSMSKP